MATLQRGLPGGTTINRLCGFGLWTHWGFCTNVGQKRAWQLLIGGVESMSPGTILLWAKATSAFFVELRCFCPYGWRLPFMALFYLELTAYMQNGREWQTLQNLAKKDQNGLRYAVNSSIKQKRNASRAF